MSKTERATFRSELEKLEPKLKKFNAGRFEKSLFELSLESKVDYAQLAYDMIGLLHTDSTIAKKDLDEKRIGFDSSFFEDAKAQHLKQLSRINEKPKAVKGVYKCSAKLKDGSVCGSDSFFMWSQQTRSGDEGMTHFRQCEKCGKRNKS